VTRRISLLSDFKSLYILYVSAGLAAIPAGLLYAIAALNGYDRWWVALFCIAIGLGSALKIWRIVEIKLFTRRLHGYVLRGAGKTLVTVYNFGPKQAGEQASYTKLESVWAVTTQSRPGTNSKAVQSLPAQAAQNGNETATPYAIAGN